MRVISPWARRRTRIRQRRALCPPARRCVLASKTRGDDRRRPFVVLHGCNYLGLMSALALPPAFLYFTLHPFRSLRPLFGPDSIGVGGYRSGIIVSWYSTTIVRSVSDAQSLVRETENSHTLAHPSDREGVRDARERIPGRRDWMITTMPVI